MPQIRHYFKWSNGPNNAPVKQSSSTGAELELVFSWDIYSQDVRTNTSVLDCALSIKLLHLDSVNAKYASQGQPIVTGIIVGNSGSGSTKDLVLTVDNKVVTTKDDISYKLYEGGATYQMWKGYITVTHDADGNKTVPVDLKVFIRNGFLDNITHISSGVNNSGYILNLTGSFTPTSISKTAAVIESFPTYFTDDDMPLLEYYNPAGEQASELYLGISFSNGFNMEIIKDLPKTDESIYISFNDRDKAAIWAATIDKGISTTSARIYIVSVVDKEVINEYKYKSRVEVQDYLPEISISVFDSNSKAAELTGDATKFIRKLSNAYYDINVSTKKGASIASHLFKNGSYANTTEYWGIIEGITDPNFYASITDSRNFSASTTLNLIDEGRWVPYVPLSINIQHKPLDASGKLRVTIFGKYFSGSFGAVTNSFELRYRATKVGDTNYQWVNKGFIPEDLLNIDEEGNYSYTFDITELDYTSQYNLIVQVKDAVYERNVYPPTIPAAKILFDWSDEDFAFKIPVSVQGNVNVSGSINATGSITTTAPISTTNSMYINGSTVPSIAGQGTYNGWSYRKWSDGTYECWRTLSLTVDIKTATNASWYSSGELSATNLTFPITFTARPVVTVQLMPTGKAWATIFPSNTTGSTTKTGSYQLMSMSSQTSAEALIAYHVKGKWK